MLRRKMRAATKMDLRHGVRQMPKHELFLVYLSVLNTHEEFPMPTYVVSSLVAFKNNYDGRGFELESTSVSRTSIPN